MAWMRSAFSPVLLQLQYNALRIQPHTNSLILLKQLLAALAMGAHGAVGRSACESCLYIVTPCFHFVSAPLYLHIIHSSAHSTFNYIGYHFNKLISAFNRGNLVEARTIQVLSICIHQLLFTSLNILCQSVTEVFVYCPRVVQDARASPLRHETWWVKVVRWCFFNSTWSKGNMILSAPFWKSFIVFDRLWSGSEQAADDWGVRLVSGAPTATCDALFSILCSVHCGEILQYFSWTRMIFHEGLVKPENLNNMWRTPCNCY